MNLKKSIHLSYEDKLISMKPEGNFEISGQLVLLYRDALQTAGKLGCKYDEGGSMERITGKTELVGLFGYPIRHSNSPKVQNEAFAMVGSDLVYIAFEVKPDVLAASVEGARAMGWPGFQCTMPNKQRVIPLLDEIDTAARLCGAVNTVVNENGTLKGYNTDGEGFWEGARISGIDFEGKKAVLVGPGGAGSAVCAVGAMSHLSELVVFCRNDASLENGKRLVAEINDAGGCKTELVELPNKERLIEEIAACNVLIDATGKGMTNTEESIIDEWADKSVFHDGLVVCDLAYSPAETLIMTQAIAHGCRAYNGSNMMICQAARAFTLWTGKEYPFEEIRKKFY